VIGKNLRSLWAETSPDKVLAKARRFLEKGRIDSAVETIREAIAAEGEDPILRIELSQILLSAGQTKEAADGLRGFLKTFPDEYRRVCDFADWARAHHYEIQPLHEVLGEHCVSRREFGAALESLERVDKKGLLALLDSRLANLQRFLDKSSGNVPKSAIPLLYFAALIHEALHDYPKAVETYRKLLSASPNEVASVEERLKGIVARNYKNSGLRAALAETYLRTGDPARAIEEYVQMVEVDPRTLQQATAALESIAESAPDPAAALWGLARVRRRDEKADDLLRTVGQLISLGKHLEETRGLLEGVMADGKEDPRLNLLVGEACLRAGKVSRATTAFMAAALHPAQEIQARSREGLERVLEQHPQETRVLESLADQYLRDGKFDACIAMLERLAALGGDSATVAASRVQTLLLARPGHPGAESLLEKLAPASGNPGLAAAFLRRKIRSGADAAGAALDVLRPLLAKDPSDPELRLATSEALAALGEMTKAWETARPLFEGTMGPDPTLFHLMVLIGGSSTDLCREVCEVFRTMAPGLARAPEGSFAIGEMAARSGDMLSALESFRAAAAYSPAAAAAVIDSIRSLATGGMLGESAVTLGEALLEAGDYAGAASILAAATELPPSASRLLAKLEESLRADPNNVDLRVALASVLSAGGRAARGREVIEEGIRQAGESAPPALHFAQGDAWLADANLGEAVRAYSRAMARDKSIAAEAARRIERVLAIDVGHPSAHLALGRALLLDGRPREGVNSLLTAWSLRPSLGGSILKDLAYASRSFPLEPQVDLARSQVLIGQGEVESASEALGAALRTAPSIATEVLVRLEALTRSHPSCARAHFHAGQAWLIKNRFREASAAFLTAAEHDSKLSEQAAAGLAMAMRASPDSPEPHLARARLYESQGNGASAAEAYRAAAARGADPYVTLEALKALVAVPGPHRAKALIALGGAACDLDAPEESARSLESAAKLAPEHLDPIREEMDSLVAQHPRCSEALLARARVALIAQDPASALRDADLLLGMAPGRAREVASIATEAARSGGDELAGGWISARALTTGGDYDAAANEIERWIPRAEGALKAEMCLLRARIEKRRGDGESARKWILEAEGMAENREAFLSALHEDAVSAARLALLRTGSTSDLWRALGACLDLGDADRAETIASSLGLTGEGRVEESGVGMGAAEIRARIACLRGRYLEASDILSGEPASAFKAYALRRAGRNREAAICLADISPQGGEPSVAARGSYLRLAAEEILGAVPCLEAETQIRFVVGPEGESG
jgi:tetratricopeptide (TPR) repeat protein